MNNYAQLCIIMLTVLTPQLRAAIECNAICVHDGDKRGIIIEKVCGCWNPINSIVIKIPRSSNNDFLPGNSTNEAEE